jgi:hypothetical protein
VPTAAAWWIVARWSNAAATLNAVAKIYLTSPEEVVPAAHLHLRALLLWSAQGQGAVDRLPHGSDQAAPQPGVLGQSQR